MGSQLGNAYTSAGVIMGREAGEYEKKRGQWSVDRTVFVPDSVVWEAKA